MYQQISAYSQHEVALSLSRWRSLHALSGGHQRPLKVCRGEPPQVTRSGGCQNKVKPRTSVSGRQSFASILVYTLHRRTNLLRSLQSPCPDPRGGKLHRCPRLPLRVKNVELGVLPRSCAESIAPL
jgi:hypothetical protein